MCGAQCTQPCDQLFVSEHHCTLVHCGANRVSLGPIAYNNYCLLYMFL